MKVVRLFSVVCAALFIVSPLSAQDRENVKQVTRVYTRWDEAAEVVVSDDYAFVVAGSFGLQILNVSNPRVVGSWDEKLEDVRGVTVAGHLAYVVDGVNGLRIIDVSDPENHVEIGFYETPGTANSVFVAGDLVYVADGRGGLRIIDVSEPNNPTQVGLYDTPGYADDVFVVGNLAYVADGGAGFRIIDVSDPGNPAEIGSTHELRDARGVFVIEDLAYVANGLAGLSVISVADHQNLTQIGSYRVSGNAKSVVVAGNLAYVACGRGGLCIVDMSNPENPLRIGSWHIPGRVNDVFVAGNRAYIADGENGLRVINVSNPKNPYEVVIYDKRGYASLIVCGVICLFIWIWCVMRALEALEGRNIAEMYFLIGFGLWLTLLPLELVLGKSDYFGHLSIDRLHIPATLLTYLSIIIFFIAGRKLVKEGILTRKRSYDTARLITSGIYSIIRHPMTLSAAVLSLSIILKYQSLPSLILGGTALLCFWLSARTEDEWNIMKFGDQYREYMKQIPMWNFTRNIISKHKN